MIQKIREIVADVTGVPVDKITEASSHETVDGWDSLAQINIIMTVESEFGATFTPEEVQGLNSVGKIAAALRSR